ncbi:DUF421 domain-containing protein [Acidovorax sp. sif1233]|uniref:DUF421 domain-containing protein n=1 Tax=Acidovorax sp. sif1233 TaxID=2854792 RepID=UPI00351CC1F7
MDVFQLGGAWWEMPLRAAIIYAVLLLLVRISGKRTVGQFTPFDLLVVMLLSESVSAGLNGDEKSVTAGLLSATTLIALNVAVAVITSRSERVQQWVEGRPVLIGSNGEIFTDVLRKHHVRCATRSVRCVKRTATRKTCNLRFLKQTGTSASCRNPGRMREATAPAGATHAPCMPQRSFPCKALPAHP